MYACHYLILKLKSNKSCSTMLIQLKYPHGFRLQLQMFRRVYWLWVNYMRLGSFNIKKSKYHMFFICFAIVTMYRQNIAPPSCWGYSYDYLLLSSIILQVNRCHRMSTVLNALIIRFLFLFHNYTYVFRGGAW